MKCKSCPFECKVDRGSDLGLCQAPGEFKVAKSMAHFWEEPCLSGNRGSGTIFFSHCNGHCLFCQNYQISQFHHGQVYQDEHFLDLCTQLIENTQVDNLNLVSPTHYSERLIQVLPALRKRISVPIVWNSNGYEKASIIERLEGLVDVFLPDFKYFDDDLAVRYSHFPQYFHYASQAIKSMKKIVGCHPVFNEQGLIQKGLIIRHLILPGQVENSKRILSWIAEHLGPQTYLSLMAQYYPIYRAIEFPELNCLLSPEEYQEVEDFLLELDFENGFLQELEAHSAEYTPNFLDPSLLTL